jgi:hypothetical protein
VTDLSVNGRQALGHSSPLRTIQSAGTPSRARAGRIQEHLLVMSQKVPPQSVTGHQVSSTELKRQVFGRIESRDDCRSTNSENRCLISAQQDTIGAPVDRSAAHDLTLVKRDHSFRRSRSPVPDFGGKHKSIDTSHSPERHNFHGSSLALFGEPQGQGVTNCEWKANGAFLRFHTISLSSHVEVKT